MQTRIFFLEGEDEEEEEDEDGEEEEFDEEDEDEEGEEIEDEEDEISGEVGYKYFLPASLLILEALGWGQLLFLEGPWQDNSPLVLLCLPSLTHTHSFHLSPLEEIGHSSYAPLVLAGIK